MNSSIIVASLAAGVLGMLYACSGKRSQPAAAAKQSTAPEELRISGPYSHENLTIWLIHGPDQLKSAKYLTLQEAMEQKKVIVHETGNVNELTIENVSEEAVFVQSGDIVKGGQQDRTIATDFIASAHSGKVPLAAFCVEQGRWTGRGEEPTTRFSGSGYMVAGRHMKRYSNVALAGDQGAVWDEAQRTSVRLSSNLQRSVAAGASPSSFQLALENVQSDTTAYTKALSGTVDGKSDVVGWVYAVNGQLTGANVYAAHDLFLKLWPKLLQSGVVEAIAEKKTDSNQPATAPSTDQVRAFISIPSQVASKKTPVNDRTVCDVYESSDSVLLQTEDRQTEQWIHRGYLRK